MRAVNLLPKDEIRVVTTTQKVAVGVGTGGAVLLTAILAMMFLSASSKVHDAQLSLDELNAQLALVPPAAAGPTPGETALASEAKPRAAAVSAALQRRVGWDRVLRQLSLVLPEDVWLTKFSANSPVSPAAAAAVPAEATPGVSAPPTQVTIVGYTYSHDAVARLLSRLAVVPELQDVTLQGSLLTNVGTQTVVQFTILADVQTAGATS
jgi:Tfp pilus assembly protein PilN